MAIDLYRKVGDMEPDGLITNLAPAACVGGGEIAALTEEATLVRGTLLGKADGATTLSVYDGTTNPDCILCDDTVVGTEDSVTTSVYIAGCFDPAKLVVADGYTLTDADKDALRLRGIILKAAAE